MTRAPLRLADMDAMSPAIPPPIIRISVSKFFVTGSIGHSLFRQKFCSINVKQHERNRHAQRHGVLRTVEHTGVAVPALVWKRHFRHLSGRVPKYAKRTYGSTKTTMNAFCFVYNRRHSNLRRLFHDGRQPGCGTGNEIDNGRKNCHGNDKRNGRNKHLAQ